MKIISVLFMMIWLGACATSPAPTGPVLFRDALFAPPTVRIHPTDALAVSDAMRAYLKTDIARALRDKGAQQGLLDAIYAPGQLKLDYDTTVTRNAAETFAAKSGNCLSLVLMTAALANELDLAVHFQGVFTGENWVRVGGMYFSAGHVNLTIGRRQAGVHVIATTDERATIDFIAPDPAKRQHTWDLSETTIIAMYLNNRAAESLANGDVTNAYWWARAAIKHDATFITALNTLGVVYRRSGHAAEAREVLTHALKQEPDNLSALSNLALVLTDLGQHGEAAALNARLAKLEPFPPFHFFNLGLDAMRALDFVAAKNHFTREVNRAAYNDEFHFWLAAAYKGLDDLANARKHLRMAQEHSTTANTRALYAAKMERIELGRTR